MSAEAPPRPRVDRPAAAADGEPAARSPRTVLVALALGTAVAIAGYLTWDVRGDWGFALELRARKVLTMAVVGHAIARSTVRFQTITTNQILTPSIMGFDHLYALVQAVAVFAFGSLAVVSVPIQLRFGLEVAVMLAFAGVLYRLLFAPAGAGSAARAGRRRSRGPRRDLYALVLAGIVLGTMFRSLRSLVSRLIDPNEFERLQDLLFASLSSVDESLLALSAVLVVAVTVADRRSRDALDVMALGRDHAVGLGVDHDRMVRRQLVVVALMVSVSTALVGPVTFFGLLVASLARLVLGTFRHRAVLPAASLLGVLVLVGGQGILEHALSYDTALFVVVNVVGGLWFLVLLLREAGRAHP